MSNRITPSAAGSTSGVQPVAASSASVSRSTISSSMPTSLRDAFAGNPARCSAARQASVAISRARVTPRFRILARQMRERLDRAQDRGFAQPARAVMPSPSRMMRENASMTRSCRGSPRHQQPAVVGAEIERRIGRAGQVQPARHLRLLTPPWRGCRYGDRRPRRGPLGSRSGTGPRPVARASSSIANLSPRRSSKPSSLAQRRGGDLALRGKV